MNPLGHRVSQFYHRALNPTTSYKYSSKSFLHNQLNLIFFVTVPIVIDNKLFLLTEQLSRHIVDTKLSFLIPHPQMNFGIVVPGYPPFQPQLNVQLQPDQLL